MFKIISHWSFDRDIISFHFDNTLIIYIYLVVLESRRHPRESSSSSSSSRVVLENHLRKLFSSSSKVVVVVLESRRHHPRESFSRVIFESRPWEVSSRVVLKSRRRRSRESSSSSSRVVVIILESHPQESSSRVVLERCRRRMPVLPCNHKWKNPQYCALHCVMMKMNKIIHNWKILCSYNYKLYLFIMIYSANRLIT